jgi:hypothetical protein
MLDESERGRGVMSVSLPKKTLVRIWGGVIISVEKRGF